jgi:curved DNA-binding protein CbpA
MGQQVSAIDPSHVRIYRSLIQIQDPQKRLQVIQTCLASMEYVTSAKRAGVYSYLLQYAAAVQNGGAMPRLPEEQGVPQRPTGAITLHQSAPQPSWKVVADTPKQKAISHFSACLEVLQIQEEVAITEEALKAAYKRMALKAHPDKGGSEEYFEAVTRAYAYLSDILKRMKGRATDGKVDAQMAAQSRAAEAKEWAKGEPVRLNAKNLDMNAFNQLFEQTHMPDPDSDGYGDWLKSEEQGRSGGRMFKGEFNRDVFNRMFEDEARGAGASRAMVPVHPGQMALTLNPTAGTSLVGDRPDSYTAATGSKFQYTDLRGAYTADSTITDKVADVRVSARSFDQYRSSRERAPDPLTDTEMHGIREFESRQKAADDMLGRRRAEMAARNQQYHDRMKQMVITDGVDLNQKKLGW